MTVRALQSLRDGLLSTLYPTDCFLCGGSVDSWDDGVVCSECWEDRSTTQLFLGEAVCAKCGAPVRPPARRSERSCGSCRSVPFHRARACGPYTGALEASIIFLKSNPHLCPRLRDILTRAISESRDALASDLIIPVPLHGKRLKERGFNQASVIARAASRTLGLPIDTSSLARVKHTERHRAGMDAVDRARSVRKAFSVTRAEFVAGQDILLVDDLYTTGSTICAAAEALIDAGASKVNVLTLARVLSLEIQSF